MSGILLILILLLSSGVIAYLGDYVGRKVGKKKLTLFNLRPKYTSHLISIITGILIMFFTLLILSISSENVRTAIFGLERLKKQLSSLQVAISIKSEELNNVTKRLFENIKEKELIREDLEKFKKELDRIKNEGEKLTKELEKLKKDKENLLKEKKSLQIDWESMQNELFELSKRISIL
jgi:uncharacterized protein (DUF3084 family)